MENMFLNILRIFMQHLSGDGSIWVRSCR